MNLNELNPTQIVLLTLLVSFVTSIATGIVTVSLVNQAPPVVTDTIHKVYEKTVERVVPSEQKATIVQNTKTIIVSEEDFVIEAVNKNVASLTRVYTYENKEEVKDSLFSLEKKENPKKFVGTALFFNKEGYLLAESQNFEAGEVNADAKLPQKKYFIESADKKEVPITLVGNQDLSKKFVFLKLENPESLSVTEVEKGNSDELKLGQSVVILGGEKSNKVLTGVISNLIKEEPQVSEVEEAEDNQDNKENEPVANPVFVKEIEVNQSLGATMIALIDLNGKFIGFRSSQSSFVPINQILKNFEEIKELGKKQEEI